MHIEHIAMYVNDLEKARDFFVQYFGMYGAQAGDGRPTISNKEQIRVTTEAIMNMINEF